MIPLGYMAKFVFADAAWRANAPRVEDCYAVSGCLSDNFSDYVGFWRHNGYWLFDSPAVLHALARAEGIDLTGTTLFYYEAYERQYDEDSGGWETFGPEPSLATKVEAPAVSCVEGFDVVGYTPWSGPTCSPLSCNGLMESLSVNKHCLFDRLELAVRALESGAFDKSEPGPFRVVAVHTL
jgi:hypothetical protein